MTPAINAGIEPDRHSRARSSREQEVHMSTLWAVTVWPFDTDPYHITYHFESLAEGQAFADKVNALPEQDRIFLSGGRGKTVTVWEVTTVTAQRAWTDLSEHWGIEED